MTFVLARIVFGLFARRHASSFDLIMVTLASSLIIQYSIDAAAQGQEFAFTFPAGRTLHAGPFVFTTLSLALMGTAVVLLALLMGMLHCTRMGKALRALSTDPQLARACGVPMRRILNLTWMVTGALAGLAGLVYVTNNLTVSASGGLDFLVLVIAAALLGGAGSPDGRDDRLARRRDIDRSGRRDRRLLLQSGRGTRHPGRSCSSRGPPRARGAAPSATR